MSADQAVSRGEDLLARRSNRFAAEVVEARAESTVRFRDTRGPKRNWATS